MQQTCGITCTCTHLGVCGCKRHAHVPHKCTTTQSHIPRANRCGRTAHAASAGAGAPHLGHPLPPLLAVILAVCVVAAHGAAHAERPHAVCMGRRWNQACKLVSCRLCLDGGQPRSSTFGRRKMAWQAWLMHGMHGSSTTGGRSFQRARTRVGLALGQVEGHLAQEIERVLGHAGGCTASRCGRTW